MPQAATRPPVRSLTIYLLKNQVRTERDAIECPDDVRAFPVPIGERRATLFVKPSRVVPPAWVGFFEGHVDSADVLLRSASSAAVLVLHVANRWFAVTFGYGRHLVAHGMCEANFGLKITLNSIDEASIRSIDRKSFDPIARHTREDAGRAGSMEQFGINVEEDLLRAVVGTPQDDTLARKMAGMDSLTVSTPLSLAELPDLLNRYTQQWRKSTYRDRYPWVDHVAEVRDVRQARDLDDQLVERLATKELEHMWLAVPVPIDWSQVGGFLFSQSKKAETHDDIHLRSFLGSVRDPARLSPKMLRRKSVYCLDPDGRYARDKWSVYECLYAEIHRDDDVFLLTGGRWYQIAENFVQQIDKEVARLRATGSTLPPYRHRSENEYNKAVAGGNTSVVLMDRENIRYGGGGSQIEFCDLFIEGRTLLHVKRYSGSSVLSHLFSQGVVSATLFLQDQEFRGKVREKLGPASRRGVPEMRPDASQYEVGFAIISRSPRDLVLPFFSKVNLRNATRTLKGLGYSVTLTKIDVESDGE